METIDKILDNLVKEVELTGRSGSDCVYKTNISVTIKDEDFSTPEESDLDGAYVDFDWFLRSAEKGYDVPHLAPDKSFWFKYFGERAAAYGSSWRFQNLKDTLSDPAKWRRAVLINPQTGDPPCILSYQFLSEDSRTLDVVVTMRSSDIKKIFPQDYLMTWLLLKRVCEDCKFDRGSITFNIANAHVYYEDCEWQEEFTIDGLD